MKASELRIGNWLQWGVHQCRVNSIVQDLLRGKVTLHTTKKGDCPISEFEPIPLTPEWLEKFGFEKDIKSSTYHKVLPDGHLQVETDYSFGICQGTFGGNAYERGNWYSGEFQYVHQLQNLYFALTGEELEIND